MKRRITTFGAALILGSAISGQHVRDDRRDVVETTKGKELRGRVLRAHDPDEVLLLQGSKRQRIPRDRIHSISTVNDRLREFFKHRHNAKDVPEREWMLVEWAVSRDLDQMARLQALHVVLEDDDHQKAHEFLGHRKRDGDWAWPSGSRWLSRAAYEDHISKWGHPLVLEGEHFRVRTSAGLRVGVDAALDLEHLYAWWFDTFGNALMPREVVGDLMDFHIHASVDDFEPWTSERLPYYIPQPNGDFSNSYIESSTANPRMMFQLGTEQLLYNALSDGMGMAGTDQRERLAGWLDIGFGQYVQSSFTGKPGYAEPTEPVVNREHGMLVLSSPKRYGLENLIGLRYPRYHDVATQTPMHWAHTTTFVAFLMDEKNGQDTRDRLLEYIQLAYGQTKGNSSSLFDKVMGRKIETLERPWIEWLEQKLGASARR